MGENLLAPTCGSQRRKGQLNVHLIAVIVTVVTRGLTVVRHHFEVMHTRILQCL